MPRMTALAELLWTNDVAKYDSYKARSVKQFPRLDNLKVNYRLPDLDGMIDSKVFVKSDTVFVTKPMESTVSPVLNRYVVDKPQTLKIAAFTLNGRRGDVYTSNYKQQNYTAPAVTEAKNGLLVYYYPGDFKGTTKIPEAKSDKVYTVNGIVVPDEVKAPAFGLRYTGFIDVPQQGVYTFYLTCDDAGVLKIDNQLTIDNDGMHSAVEKSGQAALQKGLHPFLLNFVEGGGGYTLKLQYSFNGSAPKDIPAGWFKN
jgi:hexosaminidase